MKKLLPLLFLSSLLSAQPVKLFHENFDAPSGPDSVTTSAFLFNFAGTLATQLWNDTNFLSTSGNASYHISGTLHNEISFTTSSFNTQGKPHIFLNFNHIAKLFVANQAQIYVSTNGGNNWTVLEDDAYLGQSSQFQNHNFYNEAAYPFANVWQMNQDVTPQQSWWVQEVFDLRGYAYDTISQTGYPNVKLRFTARYNLGATGSTPSNQIFRAGWFIDDVEVIGSSCELFPPQISFDSTGTCEMKPEGSIVTQPSGIVPISIIATDKGTGIDRVELIYTKNNISDTLTMNLVNASTGKYSVNIPNIGVGDTVYYFLNAYDLSCPNVTRLPDASQSHIMFYVEKSFPAKCGSPNCGEAPPTIDLTNLPWVEDFEGPEWVPGDNGVNNNSNRYRGNFPTFPNGNWVVAPPVTQPLKFAWSVAYGPTATNLTGPLTNHTPGGTKYLYTEGSYNSPMSGNTFSATRLFTPCIDLRDNNKDLAFEMYYHMFGSGIGSTGTIKIDIDTASGSEPFDFHEAYRVVVGEQQYSEQDPWKRLSFSLAPFNGKIIRISIVGIKYSTNVAHDMAIDDFSIFELPATDAALIKQPLLSPTNCNYSQTQSVEIEIQNEGADTLYNIPVAMQLDNGPIIYDLATGALGYGESMSFTFSQTISLTPGSAHQLKAWVILGGDTRNHNDTAHSDTIHNILSNFPLIVDFEDATAASDLLGTGSINHPNIELNVTDNSQTNGAKWVIYNKKIRHANRGPLGGDQRRGNYLVFTDDNGPYMPDESQMKFTCLDFSSMNNPYLSFKIHNYNSNYLEINIREMGTTNWITMSNSYATISQKSDDFQWIRHDLSSFAGKVVEILFIGKNLPSSINQEFIAIDDIQIHDRDSTDFSLIKVNSPFYSLPEGSTMLNSLDLMVANIGFNTLASGIVKIELTDTCANPPQVITGQSQHFNKYLVPLYSTSFMANITYSAPLTASEYEVKMWIEFDNDNIPYNDTLRRTLNILQNKKIPYFNDFDHCYADIFTGGELYEWEVAIPSKGAGWDSAYSGQRVAITNASENTVGTTEIMRLPVFTGFDSVMDAELRFRHQYDFGPTGSGSLEYFDQGQWKPLPPIGGAWNLSYPFTGVSGWTYTTYPLNAFNYSSRFLYLRFVVNSSSGKGWMIDDVEIHVPTQISASPQKITFPDGNPAVGSNSSLDIQLANTGLSPLSQVVIEVNGNGNVLITDTILLSPPLSSGRSRLVNLANPIIFSTYGSHELNIITIRPNDLTDQKPEDDTVKVIAFIPEPVQDIPFCSNFDSSASFSNFNSIYNFYDSDWIYGTPSKMYFSSAHSGSNAWFTSENDYSPLSQQVIATPDIEVVAGQCYSLSFWHMFDTELNFDGGTVEYSLDSGQTWWQLGSVQDTAWFNTPAIHALSAFKSGWSGQSTLWEKAQKVVRFYADATVRFRFLFASGSTNHGEGWMIDDFCFEESNGNCDLVHISELYHSGNLQIYPNPATESIKFTSTLHHLNRAYITDVHGKLIMEVDVSTLNGSNGFIRISSLSKGMYFLHLESQKDRVNSKFLKH